MDTLNAARKSILRQAAEVLLQARRTANPITVLAEELRPQTKDEGYFVSDEMARDFGDIGGWKIGASSPDVTPTFGPMPLALGFGTGGSVLGETFRRLRGLEGEVAFLLGADLPPRSTPYSRDEVLNAVRSCHPAIEVLESAFDDPDQVDKLSVLADLQINGGFVWGSPIENWQDIKQAEEEATMVVDGAIRKQGVGSNSAGHDLFRMVVWLANEGAYRTGGLKAGQWVTTGSWTGKTWASPGSEAVARFSNFGSVTLSFA
jgi:2-keto-4-pentenoate hydratase